MPEDQLTHAAREARGWIAFGDAFLESLAHPEPLQPEDLLSPEDRFREDAETATKRRKTKR